MAASTKHFVFTDGASDDLQALHYLSSKVKIAGIIVDTCVPDPDNALRNLTLFNLLYFKGKLKIYIGSLAPIPNVPIEWRLDAQYTRYYLEQQYGKHYCVPDYPSYKRLDFKGATLYTLTRVTTAVKVLRCYKIRHVYAMLGASPGDPTGEINAESDLRAYAKLLAYQASKGNVTDYTLSQITPEKVEAAKAYCLANNPPLFDLLNPPSRPTWQYWDLTMVMTYV
jgi:hypothetical protein